jgi:hypothetical protein
MRSARTDGIRCAWALVVGAALGVLVTGSGVAPGASSRDYPGPYTSETVASGVPLFLAADYHGANPVYGVVILNDTGRFRLGISCVATGCVVVRVGPDSALCTVRGRCTPDDLLGLTEDDIDAVRPIPGEEPFFHICEKHGFGWYDAVGVAPGIYLAIAKSGSAVWGLVGATLELLSPTGDRCRWRCRPRAGPSAVAERSSRTGTLRAAPLRCASPC